MPFHLPAAVGTLLPLVALLVVLSLSRSALRWLIAAFAGRTIGEQALARQPEAIHLHPAGADPWQDRTRPASLVAGLTAEGFRDAGTHSVPEMPGLLVQLLAHESGEAWAAVYEHPKAGSWFDLYSHRTDGGFTVSSLTATGLDENPDRPVVHVPGASPTDAWARFRRERPAGAWTRATVEGAVAAFERAYTDSVTWRRERGISRREVMNVANRRAA